MNRAKNERPRTDLNFAVVLFGNGGNFPNTCNVLSYVKNVKVFSHHFMIKTVLRAPFFMAILQKPESNGYDNHTVVLIN